MDEFLLLFRLRNAAGHDGKSLYSSMVSPYLPDDLVLHHIPFQSSLFGNATL